MERTASSLRFTRPILGTILSIMQVSIFASHKVALLRAKPLAVGQSEAGYHSSQTVPIYIYIDLNRPVGVHYLPIQSCPLYLGGCITSANKPAPHPATQTCQQAAQKRATPLRKGRALSANARLPVYRQYLVFKHLETAETCRNTRSA